MSRVRDPNRGIFLKMNKTGTIPEPELENIYNFGMED